MLIYELILVKLINSFIRIIRTPLVYWHRVVQKGISSAEGAVLGASVFCTTVVDSSRFTTGSVGAGSGCTGALAGNGDVGEAAWLDARLSKIIMLSATISVRYFFCPVWSSHERVCRRPST